MKNSYLVCKVDKDNVHVLIDGLPKTISREFPEANNIIKIAENYNKSRDNDERNALIGKVQELLTPGHRIQSQTDGRFEFDGKRKMYLKGTTDPIPNFLAKKLMHFVHHYL